MVFGVKDLARDLSALTEAAQLVVFAVYPRSAHTGHLEGIGALTELLLRRLSSTAGVKYRVMHGQGAVLVRGPSVQLDSVIEKTCNESLGDNLDVRAISLQLEGARTIAWLDELLGELSLRSNLGMFTSDPALRFVDGRWGESRGGGVT